MRAVTARYGERTSPGILCASLPQIPLVFTNQPCWLDRKSALKPNYTPLHCQQSIRYLPIRVLHWLQFSIKLQKATTLLLLYICIQYSELNSRRSTPNLQLLTTTPSMVIPIFWFHLTIVYCAATWKSLVLVDFCQWNSSEEMDTGHSEQWCLLIEGNPFFHLP